MIWVCSLFKGNAAWFLKLTNSFVLIGLICNLSGCLKTMLEINKLLFCQVMDVLLLECLLCFIFISLIFFVCNCFYCSNDLWASLNVWKKIYTSIPIWKKEDSIAKSVSLAIFASLLWFLFTLYCTLFSTQNCPFVVIYVAIVSMCRSHQGEITVMHSVEPLKTSQKRQFVHNSVAGGFRKRCCGGHAYILCYKNFCGFHSVSGCKFKALIWLLYF